MAATLKEIDINDLNFRTEVLESNEPVLVDFCADWLAQCKNIPAIMAKLGKNANLKLKHARARVNDCFRTAEQYRVRAFPTFLLFKNGQVVDRLAGNFSDDEMLGRLKIMLQTN